MSDVPLPSTFELSDDDPKTYHNSRKCPLLGLPAELRLKIWRLCLTDIHIHVDPTMRDRTIVLSLDTFPPYKRNSIDRAFSITGHELSYTGKASALDDVAAEKLPLLWRVCKQLYNETLDLAFDRSNMFSFYRLQPNMPKVTCYNFLGRIRRLWLGDMFTAQHALDQWGWERYATEVTCVMSPEGGPAGRRPLGRRLKALEEVWLTSKEEKLRRIEEGREGYDGMQRTMARYGIELEANSIQSMLSAWRRVGVNVVVMYD